MLKILGRIASINVRKVLWTAGELGLAYDREDWGGPTRSVNEPDFAALNPNRQIPVLIHDGFVLWESQAIMRYLAAVSGDTPLYPAAAKARALVDQWLDWNGTEFNPAWEYSFQALVRRKPAISKRTASPPRSSPRTGRSNASTAISPMAAPT